MSDNNQENFKNDYFDREGFAKNLCNLIRRQEGYQSRVISIKADFGYGKTYFAKAFKNMIDNLENNTNPHLYCHYIDIWKEDYNHNPLLALLSSLDDFVGKINFCKETTKKILKDNLKSALKTLSIELLKESVSPIPLIGKATSKTIDVVANYEDTSIFKDLNALKKVAEQIQQAFAEFGNAKIIIIIDEIDRCHPEYAIEFLETLKHFFDLKNLYFILMMNENHLKEKVKSKFGYINFEVWKDKFINLEFELPNAGSQDKFINYLIKQKYGIQDSGDFRAFDFRQENLNQHVKFSPPPIKPPKDSCLIFLKENRYQWNLLLNAFLETTYYPLNNRQLDSIFLNLKIALDILEDKPIFPTLLLGTILKNYIPLEKIKPDDSGNKFWFYGSYTEATKTKKIHALQTIFKLTPKTEHQVILYFEDKQHLVALNQAEIDNILAAQFASQRSDTHSKQGIEMRISL